MLIHEYIEGRVIVEGLLGAVHASHRNVDLAHKYHRMPLYAGQRVRTQPDRAGQGNAPRLRRKPHVVQACFESAGLPL